MKTGTLGQEEANRLTPYWKSNAQEDYYHFLWYNPSTQRAYYLEYSL
ncbi:MAG: hypothetical protein JXA37_10660 [Chloroflexia bacterium]|nr:hypothetical protein [Chloroflexia bacterium]